jgi:hypothetical protein
VSEWNLVDVPTAADALTEPYKHREQIPYWDTNRNRKFRDHVEAFPSLLDQLAAAAFPGTSEPGAGDHASRPPADLEAVACHTAITIGSVKWVHRLRLEARSTVASNLRALVGATMTSDQRTDLLRELRAWVAWAETITKWRNQPYAPTAPCPLLKTNDQGEEEPCNTRGTIRVRLDTKTAVCLNCRGTWDESNIGLLGEHVRIWKASSEAEADLARAKARAEKARRAAA